MWARPSGRLHEDGIATAHDRRWPGLARAADWHPRRIPSTHSTPPSLRIVSLQPADVLPHLMRLCQLCMPVGMSGDNAGDVMAAYYKSLLCPNRQ